LSGATSSRIFFFTGLIGLAVDGLDGAMFYHNHDMVTAHLDPVASTAPAAAQSQAIPAAAPATSAGAPASAAAQAAVASDQKK
jgi:hypothetical protein